MTRVLILVEGQTEERFVKDVLAPILLESGVYLYATILVTKRVKDGPNFKGGVTNFDKFDNDIKRLLHNGGAYVTTMLDYYALPGDFPGMDSRPPGSALDKVRHVEAAMAAHYGAVANFIPFLFLHEFEALLFSDDESLPTVLADPAKQKDIQAIRSRLAPEEINDGPTTAPSKRILSMFLAYQKPLHGPAVAQRIGLPRIRHECPHFNEWLSRIAALAHP